MGGGIPIQVTQKRLMGEGLDRHDAVHAIGAVLVGYMHDPIGGGELETDPNEAYYEELKALTAESWRKQFE